MMLGAAEPARGACHPGPVLESEMAFGERTAGTGFEVTFKGGRRSPIAEGKRSPDSPRSGLGGVGNPARVVTLESLGEIVR